jgi:hypothetical protein
VVSALDEIRKAQAAIDSIQGKSVDINVKLTKAERDHLVSLGLLGTDGNRLCGAYRLFEALWAFRKRNTGGDAA